MKKVKTKNVDALSYALLYKNEKRYAFRYGNVFFQALNRGKN